MNKKHKTKIIEKQRINPKDTGSVEVQVALITHRLEELKAHFKEHPKDLHSRRGLIAMVNARRKLLDYLKKNSQSRYQKLTQSLKLRK